ncbi:unnamed protein product [Hyaloperonospora brassicae]|uniref:SAC3/GANP/THP3 conserved domain-containing protein n=1 Tax=Hyaloperonospora brassicae TaxID=162125 RepID=A0AAV0V0Q2_HYABA|nr:unnamed protein product [Hyaloperonospora brassicae]
MDRRDSRGKGHDRGNNGDKLHRVVSIASSASLVSVSLQQEPIHGECQALCPLKEEQERRATHELSRFECPNENVPFLVAVKKYRRAAAGRDVFIASALRPAPVLLRTLRHLFTTVLQWPQSGFDSCLPTVNATLQPLEARPNEFLALYYFVNDRVRSVRQDFTVQRIESVSLMIALQQIARFYLVARLLSVQLLGDGNSAQDWSDKLNDEQLVSALSQLRALYGRHKLNDVDQDVVPELQNAGEFVAYDVLLQIDKPQDVAWMLLKLSSKLRGLPMVQRALRTFVAFQTDDYHAFFVEFNAMTVLERAALLHHLSKVWTRSLRMMNKAFGKQDRFPLETLARWMNLVGPQSTGNGDELAAILCEALDIHTQRCPHERPSTRGDASNVADCWEHIDQVADHDASRSATKPSAYGFAQFKVAPLHDQLDSNAVKLLLRDVAQRLMDNPDAAPLTATDWIMGTSTSTDQADAT